MTPNQSINASAGNTTAMGLAKAASTICLLAGLWLFVSPWVYGVSTHGNAWNSWIVGGFIVLFGIIRMMRPAYSSALSWCNMVLGIWTFFSPWIYGYSVTNPARFVNSLCVGVIVFIFSITSAKASRSHKASPLDSTAMR